MEIYLTTPQHRRQLFNVNAQLRIPRFKKRLEEMTSISVQNQILYINDYNITNDKNILQNVANAGDEFEVQDDALIKILVTLINYRSYPLKVNRMTKITKLRQKFETLTQISIHFQLIFYRQMEVTFCVKTLHELGVFHNETIMICDSRQTLKIWVATSHTESIFVYAPPFVSILKVQKSLEMRTGVPIEYQLFIHNKVNLSHNISTPQDLNIVNDARIAFYDTREYIKISVRTSFHLGPPYIIQVKPHTEIWEFEQQFETVTGIHIAEQSISHNDINLTLPWQTFCQLEILTGAEVLLGNRKDMIKYKIREENGVVQDRQSMQHQTIGILILAYLYQHDPRPNNNIKFL